MYYYKIYHKNKANIVEKIRQILSFKGEKEQKTHTLYLVIKSVLSQRFKKAGSLWKLASKKVKNSYKCSETSGSLETVLKSDENFEGINSDTNSNSITIAIFATTPKET